MFYRSLLSSSGSPVLEDSSWAVSTEHHIPLAVSLNHHQSEQLNSRHPRFWDIRKCDLIRSSMNYSHSWENIDRSRNFRTFARPEYVYLYPQGTNIAVCPTSGKLRQQYFTHARILDLF